MNDSEIKSKASHSSDAIKAAVEKAQNFIAVREALYGDTLEYKLEGGME